jgi:hypothetical protein
MGQCQVDSLFPPASLYASPLTLLSLSAGHLCLIFMTARGSNIPYSLTSTSDPHLHHLSLLASSHLLLLVRYLLRQEYNLDIQKMVLVSLHPKLHSYFSVEVKVRDTETETDYPLWSSHSLPSPLPSPLRI